MANIWSSLFSRSTGAIEERLSMDGLAELIMKYQGTPYLLSGRQSHANYEAPPNDFEGYVRGAYESDGIIFACMLTRQLIFTEARFMFQRMRDGRPGDLFAGDAKGAGSQELRLLDNPWPNGTTGELLARAIQDVDLAGNHYVVREPGRLRRLRPDWVDIVLTAPPDEAVQSDVKGYLYKPGRTEDPSKWKIYMPEELAHWSFIPDPTAQYRGMSWLTPIIREIMADKAASEHKHKFFQNAATPNLAVSFKETVTNEQFKEFIDMMDAAKGGVEHAYETLYLGGGADVTVVGADLKQLDFKATQGAGETRIAAAARVSPVIVGLSEGMQGSSLNSGNFNAAKRLVGDATMRPLWRSVAAAYQTIIRVPSDARLWYDDRDIAFLRADRTDVAEIQGTEAATIGKLVQEGFTPESVVEAVLKEDWRLLKHTGLYSVQLWPPMPDGGSPFGAPGAGAGANQPGAPGAGADKPGAKQLGGPQGSQGVVSKKNAPAKPGTVAKKLKQQAAPQPAKPQPKPTGRASDDHTSRREAEAAGQEEEAGSQEAGTGAADRSGSEAGTGTGRPGPEAGTGSEAPGEEGRSGPEEGSGGREADAGSDRSEAGTEEADAGGQEEEGH